MPNIKLVVTTPQQPWTNYYPVDLSCKKLPCPFANIDGICTAAQCLKTHFPSEEAFWLHMQATYQTACDVINRITDQTRGTP